ncbi:GNAT family N-acetyltransferase [Jatrophihabitans fulvus]
MGRLAQLVGMDPTAFSRLELGDERVVLRPWRPDDAARVHAVMQDRSMHDFLVLPDPYTPGDARDFVTRTGHEGRVDGTGLGCAVVERASGTVVGAAALRISGYHPEVGFWVAPDARGHGWATAATTLLTGFALDHGLGRVGLFCDVRNVASASTALRAGFRFEGVMAAAAPVGALGPGDLACFGRTAGEPSGPVPTTFAPLPRAGLSDGTVVVRPLTGADAPALRDSDEDAVTEATGFGGPRRPDAHWQRICDRSALDLLVGARTLLAVVDAATGRTAGSVAVRQAGPPQVVGLGYVVHPDFRGHGYAARALRLVTPWLFAQGYARVELGAKTGNVASQRSALAAGFEREGVLRGRLRRPGGGFDDEARFALHAKRAPSDAGGGLSRPGG